MIGLRPRNPLALSFDIALGLRGILEESEAIEKAMKNAKSGGSDSDLPLSPEQTERQGLLRF
jgi:hypothetical protein